MNIVLGVSGSVAAYRACDLARELMRAGHQVRVCLTDAAQKFVTPALFEALTGHPCLIDTFEEPERGRMAHIDWARQADLFVVAPATASTLAKLAHGVGDDMLTTLALAYDGPWVIAPAMNPTMYAHDATQEALAKLAERSMTIVEPEVGDVACGENGQGKFPAISKILAAVEQSTRPARLLEGQSVLITSGPTREGIDDVRFLSNRSSGKMGVALARAALWMGAQHVRVISGPVSVRYPQGCEVVKVESAEEMLAAGRAGSKPDWIVGAAAVADYRPAQRQAGKIRRDGQPMRLDLVPNPDVLAELVRAFPEASAVGFAAEPNPDLEYARAKLERKNLLAVAHNDVSDPTIGFDADRNTLTLVRREGPPVNYGPDTKLRCALWLFEQLISS